MASFDISPTNYLLEPHAYNDHMLRMIVCGCELNYLISIAQQYFFFLYFPSCCTEATTFLCILSLIVIDKIEKEREKSNYVKEEKEAVLHIMCNLCCMSKLLVLTEVLLSLTEWL